MRKEMFGLTLGTMLLALCFSVDAQQPKQVPRVGFLSPSSISGEFPRIEAFKRGLRALGYIEGKSVLIEHRAAGGNTASLAALAAELVALKVDVIVTVGTQAAQAAKQATKTIPIVTTSSDPVGTGLVESLARPGGNVTGVANFSYDLAAKRLELLKEAVPKASRLAVLWSKDSPNAARWINEMEAYAASMKFKLRPLEVKGLKDFDPIFSTMKRERIEGFVPLRDQLIVNQLKRMVELAVKNRLPAIYDDRAFTDAGGLMSYGTDLADLDSRLAVYVDKILKGRTPADLPVEQPMKFEFIVNLQAAKKIGLTIPPNLLVRAQEVIK